MAAISRTPCHDSWKKINLTRKHFLSADLLLVGGWVGGGVQKVRTYRHPEYNLDFSQYVIASSCGKVLQT